CRRKIETAPALAAIAADDIPEIGTDSIGSAFFEGVASLALFGSRLTFFHRSLRKQGFDRLLWLLGRAGLLARALLLNSDIEPGLGRFVRREERACPDVEREHDQAGAENGAENLVEFEGIHRIAAPGAGRDWCLAGAARDPGGGDEIPVCPAA